MSTATRSSPDSPPVVIRRATTDDAALLAALAEQTFVETYATENDPAHMREHVARSFGESIQRAELADPRHLILIAERDGEALGYAMLRDGSTPGGQRADHASSDTIEILRIYAVKRAIGAGIGSALMQRSLAEAAALGRRTIWLGVWERNARAIAFYTRWGFEDRGPHTFVLGGDVQNDRVMARAVAEEG